MTHHTECWAVHLDCARAEILRLRRSAVSLEQTLDATRDALDESQRHRVLLADQVTELQRLSENHDRPHLTAYSNGA